MSVFKRLVPSCTSLFSLIHVLAVLYRLNANFATDGMAARKSYAIKVFDHEIEEIKNMAKASGKSATRVMLEGVQAHVRNLDLQKRIEHLELRQAEMQARFESETVCSHGIRPQARLTAKIRMLYIASAQAHWTHTRAASRPARAATASVCAKQELLACPDGRKLVRIQDVERDACYGAPGGYRQVGLPAYHTCRRGPTRL